LAAAKARRQAELLASRQAAFESAVPQPLRIEIEMGMWEPGGKDALATLLVAYRIEYKRAATAITEATTNEAVSAVAWTWPESEITE
jgi:hypothetical protein